jgi:RNA polymerase sigma-70 factor (ECF subfamily)
LQTFFEAPEYFAELYNTSGAQTLGLSFRQFASILLEVSARYLAVNAKPAEAETFYRSLRLEDLVLARACAYGTEAAWDCFLKRYRQKLYQIAVSIAREESAARELADSLASDLFGTRTAQDGSRISKLASYTGRGSLEGWLRAILAQEYVNRYRTGRRLVSLDEQTEVPHNSEAAKMPVDPRLEQATDAALLELSAEERFILASYYLDERSLAEIARMLRLHESTVSRRVVKLTARLRKRIVQGLRQRGMDSRAAKEAMDIDVRDITLDLRRILVQERNE